MTRFRVLLLGSASLCHGLLGQEILKPTLKGSIGGYDPDASRVLQFQPTDAAYLVAITPKTQISNGAAVVKALDRNGAERLIVNGTFSARGGLSSKWIVFKSSPQQTRQLELIQWETGERTSIPIKESTGTFALKEDLLATIEGLAPNRTLRLYRCQTGALEASYPIPSSGPALRLYFKGSDRLLLVDENAMSVTVLLPKSALALEKTYQLSGKEVAESRDRESKAKVSGFRAAGTAVMTLLVGYEETKNGHDLFVHSPYNRNEGLRIAEYDGEGKELKSYRVKVEDAAASAQLVPSTLAGLGEELLLVSNDGKIWGIPRP